MKRILIIATLAACGVATVADAVSASVTHYTFPANIALELKKVDETHVDAIVESRLGAPSDVALFFESSDDMRVEPASATIASLSPNRPGTYRLTIAVTGKAADASGSWVRLRAVYRPDYDALIGKLSDKTLYPDDSEQRRLIEIASRNKASGAVYTDAARLDIERESPQRRKP